jgi:hypothetical protein
MSNPSKQKGTGGETELLRLLDYPGLVRTPPTTLWDLELPGNDQFNVLATRPDHGQWLMTMDLNTFKTLFGFYLSDRQTSRYEPGLRIEVKRYSRFALHAIWNKKFGRKA